MLESLSAPRHPMLPDPTLLIALELAAGAFARLDQALDNHPLRSAFLWRVRLEAVRRQAAADGRGIDPWHLAAVLEGLRLRMDDALHVVDRGEIFDAARTALSLHQWITEPDFDQEGEVQTAERHLAAVPPTLVGAAEGLFSWLNEGGERPPIRVALIRSWVKHRLLRTPVPLTGPRALSADAPERRAEWIVAFLDAIASEAADYHELLRELERHWFEARGRITVRRGNSRAGVAVDVLAAAPLMAATSLARAIGMSVKCAIELLDRFVAQGVVVEVTHRSARRLFGLSGLAPMREATIGPRRPMPGRGRGRPPGAADREEKEPPPPAPIPSVTRHAWPAIDHAALEAAMVHCDEVVRNTRRVLRGMGREAADGELVS